MNFSAFKNSTSLGFDPVVRTVQKFATLRHIIETCSLFFTAA